MPSNRVGGSRKKKASNGHVIEVTVLRPGEYGKQHRATGAKFNYTLTEQDQSEKSLPSWLEADGFTTRDKPAKLSGVEA